MTIPIDPRVVEHMAKNAPIPDDIHMTADEIEIRKLKDDLAQARAELADIATELAREECTCDCCESDNHCKGCCKPCLACRVCDILGKAPGNTIWSESLCDQCSDDTCGDCDGTGDLNPDSSCRACRGTGIRRGAKNEDDAEIAFERRCKIMGEE